VPGRAKTYFAFTLSVQVPERVRMLSVTIVTG